MTCRDEIAQRLPNTSNMLTNLGLVLREHLQRAAEHCDRARCRPEYNPMLEFDAINDTVIVNHLKDAVDTVLKSFVHVHLERPKT